MIFTANNIQTEIMKSRNREAVALLALNKFADALFHFACSLVGKGYRGDMACRQVTFLNKPGYFLRNNAGFTAASTSQHQTGPVNILDGFALAGVKIGH